MIPTQLYHDLQTTFENTFYCAAKYQEYHPDLPLFLFLLGTDVLERIFGNMRQKSKCGFDALEMIYMCRSMTVLSEIFDKHPDWTSGRDKMMSRLCLDYSNPSNWDSSKLTLRNVNLPVLWEQGRQMAEMEFLNQKNCDFFKMNNVTLLKPLGKKKVGLTPLDCEIVELSVEEIELSELTDLNQGTTQTEITETETEETETMEIRGSDNEDDDDEDEDEDVAAVSDCEVQDSIISSIIDYVEEPAATRKFDNQLLVDGEFFFKASVVRQLFDSASGSSDRLKRVNSLSKYNDLTGNKDALENVVMLGDPILFDQSIAVVRKLTSANKKVKVLDGDKLHDPNVLLDVQFIDLTLQDLEDGVMFVWTGKFKGGIKKKVLGSECNLVQPVLVNYDGKSCFAFDRNFIIDFQIQLDIEKRSLGRTSS